MCLNNLLPRMLVLCLLATGLISGTGCGRSSPPVRFILPKGFQGKFVLRANRPDGDPLKKEHGWIVLRISNDGELSVNDDPFSGWYSEEAKYADGTDITSASRADANGRTLGADEIAFWGLWTNEKQEHWYFVGTENEKKLWMEKVTHPDSPISVGKRGKVIDLSK